MLINWYSSTVVRDRDAAIEVDLDHDISAVAGHRLVDGIINDFVDEMVEPTLREVTDVARRPCADRFDSFQNLYVLCGIVARRRRDGLGFLGIRFRRIGHITCCSLSAANST